MTAALQLIETPKFSVLVLAGPHAGDNFEFKTCPLRIGRATENEVPLPKDPKISRVHVEIQYHQGQFSIHNLSEKNIVLVNDQNVRNTVVTADCRINLGDTTLQFLVTDRMLPAATVRGLAEQSLPSVPANNKPALKESPPLKGSIGNALEFPPGNYVPTGSAGSYSQPGMAYVRQENSKILFYVIIIALVSLFAFFLTSSAKKRKHTEIRTSEEQVKTIDDSRESLEEMQKEDEKLGMNTPQFQLAEQQYTKGFRDYRLGQYNRAITELGSALAFFPQHSRARRYYTMAQRKLDEQIKSHMNEGLKYKNQGNFRMCTGAYEKSLRLMNNNDPNDANVKEARQLKQECEYELRSHY